MRFEPIDTCSKFIIETRIDRWLKSFRDADYYLFVEDGNDWVQTESARKWAREKRVKGIIKATTFTVTLEQSDKIRLLGNYSAYGPITVNWRVTSARRAFNNANGLCEAVLAEVGHAAQSALSSMALEGNAVNNGQVTKAIGATLSRRFREKYGVELSVIRCNLTSQLTDIAEAGDYDYARQTVQLTLDERRRHHELGMRLLEEQQRIQLAAAEVFALGQAGTAVERGRWELMQDQIAAILGPNADPLLAMAMMMGPEAYGQVLETRVEAQRIGLDYDLQTQQIRVLQSVADAQYRRGQVAFVNTTPYVPALEPPRPPVPGSEGIEARLRSLLPELLQVTPRQVGDKVEYTLSLHNMKSAAATRDGRITGVKYGSNTPSATWSESLPDRGSLEESLAQLARDIADRRRP